MKTDIIPFAALALLGWACHTTPVSEARQEIRTAEAAFAEAAASKGVKQAFIEFADDSAVISRSGRLYAGKKGIADYYNSQPYHDIQLSWTPDYVRVSGSGDLGYTYGRYHFAATDSTGKSVEADGIFHTVWRKQPDGSWKFIYD